MQPKKHYFAHIPTIAIFIVFAMSAPLGVLLFILKSIDKNAEKEETAAAQAPGRLSFRPRPRTCADGSPAGKRANLRPRCSHQRAEGCQGAS